MRKLTIDPQGMARFIDREAAAMDPLQLWRELVQNGIEAGADSITIDGWQDPDTNHWLARCSDHGSGMTSAQLTEHLATMHTRVKGGENYGVGARMAALPRNPAGVTFASRTATSEGLVRLVKFRGAYGVKEWDVVDEDGYEVNHEFVTAEQSELGQVKNTGTAVILHGDGHEDTWDPSVSYQVHKFLSQRYYHLPEGVRVSVSAPDGATSTSRPVRPFGDMLAEYSTADGEVRFTDVAGLSGNMFWWILPPQIGEKTQGRYGLTSVIGLVAEDEIFHRSRQYANDFGLLYRSVASRVVVLIWISGAQMDTARAGLVFPGVEGSERRNIPWKALGRHFAAHMPAEIEDLLSEVTTTDSYFDETLAKLLDEDWQKKLKPVPTKVPDEAGEPAVGDEDELPGGGRSERPRPSNGSGPGPVLGAQPSRPRHPGSRPAKLKPKIVAPTVEFVSEAEFNLDAAPEGITWIENRNRLQICDTFAPYRREIARWAEQTNYPVRLVTQAVQAAYKAEYAGMIIDANGQDKHGASAELVDLLKSGPALYAKALGMQSLSARIEAFLNSHIKNEGVA